MHVLKQMTNTMPIFRQLTPDLQLRLCQHMRYLVAPAGTVVTREGEHEQLFYIILSGSVAIHKLGVVDTAGQARLEALASSDETKALLASLYSTFGARVTALGPSDAFGQFGVVNRTARYTTAAVPPC